MSKPIHHKLDIYGTELHAAFDHDGWKRLRRINRVLEPAKNLGYGVTYTTQKRDTDQQHIWVYVDRAKCAAVDELVDTASHEATHAAMSILERHAIDLDASQGEPLAYLVGWITNWLWVGAQQHN